MKSQREILGGVCSSIKVHRISVIFRVALRKVVNPRLCCEKSKFCNAEKLLKVSSYVRSNTSEQR